ncbi:MAG: NAD-dependent epimerase/dehydratase family protein [Chloroflexota bacterium]
MSDERFLVTGALGCVGAWTVRELLREGTSVVGFDLGTNSRRVDQILAPDERERLTLATGDITDLAGIERVLDEHGITNVIHLAALQVPFCRADPPLGAAVNVVGTVNVFEAVRRRGLTSVPVVYASSMAAYSLADIDPVTGRLEEDAQSHPANHYGVYKVANEGNARIYWADAGVASIGVRPMTVYGVGRDQGMTSGPTVAIAAAVLGQPYEIAFGGATVFQYAEDVAKTLLLASRADPVGARVFNLGGDSVAIPDWIAAVDEVVPGAAAHLSFAPTELPFPSEIAHESLASLGRVPVTPYRDGIRASAEIYRRLAAEGRLVATEQGLPAVVPAG